MKQKMEWLTIDQRIQLAQDKPNEFRELAEEMMQDNIVRMCKGKPNSGHCEWNMKGLVFRLNQEAATYKDPVARLNFIISRFYDFINKHYSSNGDIK